MRASIFLIFWFLLVAMSLVRAADIYPVVNTSYIKIVIEGEIKSGDYDEFIDIAKNSDGYLLGVEIF